jgi:nucleoside-diphosphate-sugar epimerase
MRVRLMNLTSFGRSLLPSKVVVTGATGFIGKALVARLHQDRCCVEGLSSADGDIAKIDLDDRLANFRPDHIVHLAGRTFVPDSWHDPLNFYRINVQGTVNVADYCRRHSVSLVYVSAYVYGKPVSLPIREDYLVQPNNPYAQSKFLGEEVCRQYAATFKLPVVILRPFNVYGPGQSSSFLIPTIVHQALHNDVIELDSLTPRRDYVYVDDLVEAIVLSLRVSQYGVTYNIGSGYSVSVHEVVQTVLSRAGVSKPVFSRNIERENEVMDVVADISRVSRDFSWHPQFTLADGIDAMLCA